MPIYDPRTTRPNPNGTGFVRDPFPGNIIPEDRLSSISRYFQSFLPDPTNAGLQNNYLGGSLPIGFNNESVTGKVDLNLNAAAADVGAVLARQAQPGHAVPRRQSGDESSDRLAAAVRGDPPRRGGADERADQAHLRPGLEMGQPGQRRLLAPLGADFQRDDRRPVSDQGRSAGVAGRRGRFIVSGDRICRTQCSDAVAGDGRAGVHRISEQLHVAEQSELDPRQACDDLRPAGAAHGRRRARAHLRQSGDLRLQQRADGGVQSGRDAPAGHRQRLCELSPRRSERDQRDPGLAGRDQRALLHLRVLGAGRFQAEAQPDAEPRAALRHHEAVHGGPRSMVVPGPDAAESGGRRLSRRHGLRGGRREQLPLPDADRHLSWGDRTARRGGVQPERSHGPAGGVRHQLFPPRRRRRPRRRAQRHRNARLLCQRELPERERLRSLLQLEQRRAVLSAAAVLRSDAQRRFRGGPRHRRHRHLRRSRDRRTAASLPELERRPSVRARTDAHRRRDIRRRAAATSSASPAAAGAGCSRISSIRATSCWATC